MKLFLSRIVSGAAALFAKLKNLHVIDAIKKAVMWVYKNGIAAGKAILSYLKNNGVEGFINLVIAGLSFGEIIRLVKKGVDYWKNGRKSKEKTATESAMSDDMESKNAKKVIKEGAKKMFDDVNAQDDIDLRMAEWKDKLEASKKGVKRRQQVKFIANACKPHVEEGEVDLMDIREISRSYRLPIELVYWLMWRAKLVNVGLTQSEILTVAKEAINTDGFIYKLVNKTNCGSRIFTHIENTINQYVSVNEGVSWDDDYLLDYIYDSLVKENKKAKSNRQQEPNTFGMNPMMNPMMGPMPAMAGAPSWMNPMMNPMMKMYYGKSGAKKKGKKSKR